MPKTNSSETKGKMRKAWERYKNSFHAKSATILIISACLLIVCHTYYPDHQESLNYITAVLIAFSGIFSAVYVGRGLVDRSRFEKLNNSFEFNSYFNSHEFNKLKEVCKDDYDHRDYSPKDLVEKVKSDKELFYNLKSILNKFEDLSLAIQEGYVEEKTVYWALDKILDFYVTNFMSYIREMQSDDEEYYQELMELHKYWSSRRYMSTGNSVDE